MIKLAKDDALLLCCLLVLIGGFIAVITSCSSFKPVGDIDRLPVEVVYSYNVMKLYSDSKDKSGAAPSIALSTKVLIKIHCQTDAYGVGKDGLPNRVDESDIPKYKRYVSCWKELQ